VPLPIGNLSDYGAVFDRHGRAEVDASIAEMSKLLRLDVYILLTWESDGASVSQLASAVFSAWGLAPRRALLAVFLRTGADWAASVAASSSVRAELAGIEQRLQQRMADLVEHRRIEEAVRAMFDELKRLPAAQRASAAPAKAEPSERRRAPTGAVLGGAAAFVVLLALLIRWRVCPRCAGILRAERSRVRARRRADRVYSCRRCGYRRER
jgi:uncharacterized membrane protein YgcG